MSKYLFLLWQDETKNPTPGTPESDTQMAAYGAMFEAAQSAGVFDHGDPLTPAGAGQTVRVRNDSTESSKGGFPSSTEQLIGYYVLECKDDADAAKWAATIPAAALGAIEVRQIWVM
jgi:hypothetical protein